MANSWAVMSYRFAVLGDPVEHSRSPELHTAMLDLAGLEGEFLKVRADRHVLRRMLDELRRGDWDGLNVTMPLKKAASSLADGLSPRAQRAGSVNTLFAGESGVFGDTTDATTFHQLLTAERFEGIGSVLVLGAGGSASAALAAMPEGRNVYVSTRRPGQAENLTRLFEGNVAPWGAAVAGALVINATPIGMTGEALPEVILDVAGGLIDLPYGSEKTSAVARAQKAGLPHADGHEFLLRQAIASFSLWTGIDIGLDALVAALRKL